jgi:hypothetical protein
MFASGVFATKFLVQETLLQSPVRAIKIFFRNSNLKVKISSVAEQGTDCHRAHRVGYAPGRPAGIKPLNLFWLRTALAKIRAAQNAAAT